MRLIPLLLAIVLALPSCALGQLDYAHDYGKAKAIGRIGSDAIRESSGVAIGHANPDRLWTHNDSGDAPRLFLLARDGSPVATYAIADADAHDWEDICSFTLNGKPWLLVGDTGDNARRHPFRSLYFIEEPAFDAQATDAHALSFRPTMRIDVTFPDRPRDCEGVAFDPVTRTILLVSKEPSGGPVPSPGPAEVFAVTLPDEPAATPILAQKLGELAGVQATGADVSPDGLRLIVSTLGDAVLVERRPDQPWADALQAPPLRVTIPFRWQGESICFDTDGRSLITTSEGRNQFIWRVPREK